ncbi:MAG: hypothetical protein IPK16_09285 [Anaerolineales bacterium]|nr:hypothetical protein [Anaerolineales bacterium]
MLYQGIKGFLLTENAVAKSIPGASSLMKLGQNALSAASPQMEKNIDKQLVAFINNNIQQTINDSERFLDTALDAEMLQRLGDELWAAAAHTEVATIAGYFDADSVRSAAALVLGWWADFRRTAVFHDVLESVVRGFHLHYGKQPVVVLLHDAGITQKMVLEDLVLFAQPIAAAAIRSGALEAHIRQQLTAFYAEYTGNQE